MSKARPTNWFALDGIECGEAWTDGDETCRWRTNRLFDPGFPFSTGVETGSLSGVYVEVDPGDACETHTHDVEEVVVVHRGTLAFTVDDEVTTRVAGEASVVPQDAPHGFRNVGDEPAGVLGFMPTHDATTRFERVVEPIGTKVMGPDGPVVEGP